MIVPSYTDDRILQELMDDWPGVKRKAKKLGESLMARMPKSRIGLNRDRIEGNSTLHTSKNGNKWRVSAYCQQGSTTWWSVCYCEAENDHGTKSYFYLRGMNTPKQYYVHVIPHAIKRIRERWITVDRQPLFADKSTQQIMDWAVFDRHECGIFFAAGKVRKGVFQPFTDGDGNTPGIVTVKYGNFYARRTPLGNFIFKTYIISEPEPGSLKDDFRTMLIGLWRSHNMPKGHDTLNERVEVMAKTALLVPRMEKHFDHYLEKVVPMYP